MNYVNLGMFMICFYCITYIVKLFLFFFSVYVSKYSNIINLNEHSWTDLLQIFY